MSIEIGRAVKEAYRDQCVLVTGAAGAIGSHLTGAIADLGASCVVALDDLSQGFRWNVPDRENIVFIKGRVEDTGALDQAFSHRPSIVFHLASVFANQRSIDFPQLDLMTNGMGTLLVLERAQRLAARVVFTSTSCTLSSEVAGPVDERLAPVHHDTPYQITKALGEHYCQYFGERYGLDVVRLRLFNSYGPGDLPGRYRSVIPNFFSLAMRGEPLPVFGTGSETRDWTFVADVVDGVVSAGALPAASGRVLHLGTGNESTVLSVATEINRLTGNAAGVSFQPRRSWDHHARRVASTEAAKTFLDYNPRVTLEQGLRLTAEWFSSNWPRIQEEIDNERRGAHVDGLGDRAGARPVG